MDGCEAARARRTRSSRSEADRAGERLGGRRLRRPDPERRTWRCRESLLGFTLLEMLVVVLIVSVTFALGFQVYARYLRDVASERAAKVFARDLALARANAVQTRSTVVLRFDESEMRYEVVGGGGTILANRRYGPSEDQSLEEMTLDLPGDSIVVNGRGIVDISGAEGELGTAEFRVGDATATVSFNSLGASRIDES